MSTQRDISQLPGEAKDFLRRQGISLNPLVWYASYQLPDDAKNFQPEHTRQRFYLLKGNNGYQYLTRHEHGQRGTVFEIRRSEGIGGPGPVAQPVELVRGKIEDIPDDPLPSHPNYVPPPKHYAEIRLTYPGGSEVKAPYTIQTDRQTFSGHLTGSVHHGFHHPSQVTYQIGEPVPTEDRQAELDLLKQHCQTLADRLDDHSEIQAIPARTQALHLINTRVLLPGDPQTMPIQLFSGGYPFPQLFDAAAQCWQQGHYRPDHFGDALARQRLDLNWHLALSLGVSRNGLSPADALLDLIYCLNDPDVMQPLISLATRLDYSDPQGWAMEATLVALFSRTTQTAEASRAGNHSPHHDTLAAMGRSLHRLADWMRQQDKVVRKTAPDSQPITATIPVPSLSANWPSVPEPNWVELGYNDQKQPFPPGTTLAYWLYDDNDELLYEGDDLRPNTVKRFLLPDDVGEVSYRFAFAPQRSDNPDTQRTFDSMFPTFGQPIVHLYDVGPIIDWQPGLAYPSRSNTGNVSTLRPFQVDLLQRALGQINLPVDERGHPLPNTYVLLASSESTYGDIKTEIEKQLGSGLTEEDWQLVEQQLSPLNEAEPKILDLTWLYADLLFRAAAERYENPEVQRLIAEQTRMLEQLDKWPEDPWYASFSRWFFHWPGPQGMLRNRLWHSQRYLKETLDNLLDAQKDANLIPYRHVNREFMDWIDQALFTVATFFVPIEGWLITSGQAFLALMRTKYFIGGAALGLGAYSGDAQAGRFKAPELTIAQGAIRATAAKTLLDDAVKYGLRFKGVNAPTHLSLDGSLGPVRQRYVGEIPAMRLPPAPNGHHWYRHPSNGTYNTKRNPGYNGPRKEYDAEEGRFYESSRATTPGTNRYKAEFAENAAYEWMVKEGHQVLPGFRRPLYGHHGIDGIFLNKKKPPTYIIIEAKYHKSTYGSIAGPDGVRYKQMSDEWIEAKAVNQVDRDLLLAIADGDFEKIGLRYQPDLGRVIKEEITW